MGILEAHLKLLAMEHENHPIKGQVLTLGQQAVYATLDRVKQIYISEKVSLSDIPKGFDIKNKIPHWIGTENEKNTNAQATLTLLGAERVFVCDSSNYENPDFLIDLNYPVNKEYYERFDVILDVGTLEHVFDISTALRNINYMLKKGGHIILILPASNAIDHGFYSFSPTLFYDFFTANNFSNFSCYLREGNPLNYMQKGKLYRYNFVGWEIPLLSKKGVDVCFFATKDKGAFSEQIEKPIQSVYAKSVEWKGETEKVIISNKSNSIKQILKKLYHSTDSFRPKIIDTLRNSKRRKSNLTYLGKF